MTSLCLFARIANTSVAFRTDEIEAVVRITDICRVPGVPPYVEGLAALRSRVLTVINLSALIKPETADDMVRSYAIVSDIAGHSYGFLVDEVIDISEVEGFSSTVRGRTDPEWSRHAEGVILNRGRPHLLLPLRNFVEQANLSQAA